MYNLHFSKGYSSSFIRSPEFNLRDCLNLDGVDRKSYAIAFDATSVGASDDSSPLQWNHTCTGSDRVLIVSIGVWAAASPHCTAVTYNGDAMTQVGADRTISNASESMWILVNPDTGGAYQISATFSGTTDYAAGTAASYTGCKQTGQPDAVAGNTGSTINPSVTVATVADNCWVVGGVSYSTTGDVSANLTSRQDDIVILSSYKTSLEDTNGPKTPAGNQVVGFTGTTANWGFQACSIAPAAAAGGPANVKTWNGLAIASIKTINGLAIASVKTVNGLA